MIEQLLADIKLGGRVYIIGNGGSYANAMHICNDLLSVGVRAYTMDPATLTAFANDYGYEHAFSRWLQVVGENGDVLIALSGSGASSNIQRAILVAKCLCMYTNLITHYLEGEWDMQRSEEEQIEIGHALVRGLKK